MPWARLQTVSKETLKTCVHLHLVAGGFIPVDAGIASQPCVRMVNEHVAIVHPACTTSPCVKARSLMMVAVVLYAVTCNLAYITVWDV
jgi:hypothetical protein